MNHSFPDEAPNFFATMIVMSEDMKRGTTLGSTLAERAYQAWRGRGKPNSRGLATDPVFDQPNGLTPGDTWDTVIPKAQMAARVVIVIIDTHDENGRWFAKDSIARILGRKAAGGEGEEVLLIKVRMPGIESWEEPHGLGRIYGFDYENDFDCDYLMAINGIEQAVNDWIRQQPS